MQRKTDLSTIDLSDENIYVTDPTNGQKVPLKIALGKKQIKIENSLLYSVMLYGTMSDKQINDYNRLNGENMSQNDKISHYLYSQASKHDKEAINALIELNLAIAKRDKTTIINLSPNTEEQSKADSIIDRLEAELANINEAEVSTPKQLSDVVNGQISEPENDKKD